MSLKLCTMRNSCDLGFFSGNKVSAPYLLMLSLIMLASSICLKMKYVNSYSFSENFLALYADIDVIFD